MAKNNEIIKYIGVGLALAFAFLGYVSNNYVDARTFDGLVKSEEYKDTLIIKRLDSIENKLDRLNERK